MSNLPPLAEPPESLHPRVLAYVGDGVYELHVRHYAIRHATHNVEQLHRYTTERVKASFQVALLVFLTPSLTEEEAEVVRRGRNVPVSVGRRAQQSLYRGATAFEALIGYLHLTNPRRLEEIWRLMAPLLEAGREP